jgi:hypothetical protein
LRGPVRAEVWAEAKKAEAQPKPKRARNLYHYSDGLLAGSNRSGRGGNDPARAFDGKGRFWRLRESVGRNVSER